MMLVTRDARGLYERPGLASIAHLGRWMERHLPGFYGVDP